MKKSILIGAILIISALVFTSCDSPNNSFTDAPAENTSDQNTGNENPSNKKEQPVTHDDNETQENTSNVILSEDIEDCTKTIKVSEIVFSDGTWELLVKRQLCEETQGESDIIFEAVNNTTKLIQFTTCYDYGENFPEELKNLTEEEQLEWLIAHNGMFPPEAIINISLVGTKITYTLEMSASYVTKLRIEEFFSSLSENAIIKVNNEKTKYVLKENVSELEEYTAYIAKL